MDDEIEGAINEEDIKARNIMSQNTDNRTASTRPNPLQSVNES